MITVNAGKVPGRVVTLRMEGAPTVLDIMKAAARECGFDFRTEEYNIGEKKMLDVPCLNGRELCRREGQKIVRVLWDTPVSDGDNVLLVPKISGNQIIVTVAVIGGEVKRVALIAHDEPEARMHENAGSVADAIKTAGFTLGEDDEILLNNKRTRTSQWLRNNDEITIKRAIAVETDDEDDDEISVICGRLSEKLQVVKTDKAIDLEDFLRDMPGGPAAENEEVLLNGNLVNPEDDVFALEDGDTVIIVKTQSCVVL